LTLVLANADARQRNNPTDVSGVHGTCDAITITEHPAGIHFTAMIGNRLGIVATECAERLLLRTSA
jgi:hypothetical protein